MKRILFAIIFLSNVIACEKDTVVTSDCITTDDCSQGLVCNETLGQCKCETSDGCELAYPGQTMFCNSFGDCQNRPACIDNADCNDTAGSFCNSLSGTCMQDTNCGLSIHCSLGQICDRATGTCKTGCNNSGDCPLGQVCTGAVGSKTCQLGQCESCENNTQCAWGEMCNLTTNTCFEPDGAGVLCSDECNQQGCGEGYVCLIDTALPIDQATGVQPTYCSKLGCQTSTDCPYGYENCGSLIFVAEECQTGGAACSNSGPCIVSNESSYGHCACMQDSDCPDLGTCTNGTCSGYSNFSCNNDDDCKVICEPFDEDIAEFHDFPPEAGNCATKVKVCGKGSGITCNTLLVQGTAPCNTY